MRNNERTAINANVSGLFTSLLTIAFIVLKLCHVIEWSWIWVLSPLWIPLALILVIWAIGLIIGFIGIFFDR